MDKNMDMMKKIIEAKKNNGAGSNNKRATKNIGSTSKGVKVNNGGGLFSK
ncbi:MAG: hypothetical protein RR620_01220 [Clostridium sp.]